MGKTMEQDRIKWNSRYGGDDLLLGPEPSAWLTENIGLIEALVPGRKALDIACGEGRNSIYLAGRGFAVTGLDISEAGLAKARSRAAAEGYDIDFRQADLEAYAFVETYDLILNFNFLLRDLVPRLVGALHPGGVLVFDTILSTPSLQGVHTKDFLLQPGELERLFSVFSGTIIRSEERPLDSAPTAKLIFCRNGGE
jgi:tellurite methyltransferase